MAELKCTKCGGVELFLEPKGAQTGLYCEKCGWLKWVSGKDLPIVKHQLEHNEKSSNADNNFSKWKADFTAEQLAEMIDGRCTICPTKAYCNSVNGLVTNPDDLSCKNVIIKWASL